MQLFKKSPTPAARTQPVEDLAHLKVTDARPGDMLSISGAGDKMTDLDFTADHGTRFEAGSHSWLELSGPYLERRVSLRVGGDEDVEVFVHNDARKLTLEDLGVSEDDMAQMDERQNTADSFEFDGVTWMYRLSREVQGRRENQTQDTGSYYWNSAMRKANNCWLCGRPKATHSRLRCTARFRHRMSPCIWAGSRQHAGGPPAPPLRQKSQPPLGK